VRCLRLESNLGFGAALNRGAAESEAAILVFLNNDTIADERFCEQLVAAQVATDAEMVAGCLARPDRRIESLGVELDRSLVAYDVGYGEPLEGVAERHPDPPLAPSGGAGAYVRGAFQSVGGFDEGFFAYLEDVDLGIRMRMAGMRCGLAPEAIAWHEHSATLGSGSAAKNRLMGSGRRRLVRKYGANVGLRERARGHLVDAIVYAGKAVIDRNLGAVRGRLGATREPKWAPDPRFASVPLTERGVLASLRLRLARRGF
jgi:GT2 family glycosyltransferase